MNCNDFVKIMVKYFRFTKLKLPVLFFICVLYACNDTKKQTALHPKQCTSFKEGTFYNKNKTYKIIRTANNQVEYDLLTNAEYHFEVHWLYDCAYNLTFKHSTNKADTFALKQNDLLRIQFIEIIDNSITYEVDFKNDRYKSTIYLEE